MTRKDYDIRALKAYQDRKAAYVREQRERPCTDCGVQYPWYVMEYDHLPQYPKSFGLSQTNHVGWDKIKLEIAKCEVVCANCHNVRTYQRSTDAASDTTDDQSETGDTVPG